MVNFRTGDPPSEKWAESDIMAYLGCDETKAKEIMDEFRRKHGVTGYDAVEKHLILDFINEKQRIEREREARYNADIAAARQVAVLEEQVKTLKEHVNALKEQVSLLRESNASTSASAAKTRTQAIIANFISIISVAIAIIALVLKSI